MPKRRKRNPIEKLLPTPTRPIAGEHHRHWPWAGMGCVAGWLIYLAAVRALWGPEQSWWLQKLLGLCGALLAVAAYYLLARKVQATEEMLQRLRLAQHSDFGKLLLHQHQPPKTVKLPIFGEVTRRALGGFGVFFAVALWWCTPWAPVHVKQRLLDDMAAPLTEEIIALQLVLLDGQVALPQPPSPPPQALKTAKYIGENDSSYLRALKAVAESRNDDAQKLFVQAMADGSADPLQVEIGRAQNDMFAGRFDDALSWYRDAGIRKADDPLIELQTAAAEMQTGDFAEAESLLANIVKKTGAKSEDKIIWAAALNLQAALAPLIWKDIDAAESLCVRSRRLIEEAAPDRHGLSAASLNNQAVLFFLSGQYLRAGELFDEAQNEWNKLKDRNPPGLAASLQNDAVTHLVLGEYDESHRLLERLQQFRKSPPHDHLLQVYADIAAALWDEKLARYADSQKILDRALTAAKRLYEEGHPVLGVIHRQLAALQIDRSKYAQAAVNLNLAEKQLIKTWPMPHPFLLGIQLCRVRVLLARNKTDEAAAMCRDFAERGKKFWGEGHPALADADCLEGRLEAARGQPRAALSLFEKALKLRTDALGKNHPQVACVLALIAAQENGPQNFSGGEAKFNRALEIVGKSLGEAHPEVAQLLDAQAAFLAAGKKIPQAVAAYERALSIQEKAIAENNLPPDDLDLALTLEGLANALAAANPPQTQRAADLQKRAKTIREKSLD